MLALTQALPVCLLASSYGVHMIPRTRLAMYAMPDEINKYGHDPRDGMAVPEPDPE